MYWYDETGKESDVGIRILYVFGTKSAMRQ